MNVYSEKGELPTQGMMIVYICEFALVGLWCLLSYLFPKAFAPANRHLTNNMVHIFAIIVTVILILGLLTVVISLVMLGTWFYSKIRTKGSIKPDTLDTIEASQEKDLRE